MYKSGNVSNISVRSLLERVLIFDFGKSIIFHTLSAYLYVFMCNLFQVCPLVLQAQEVHLTGDVFWKLICLPEKVF